MDYSVDPCGVSLVLCHDYKVLWSIKWNLYVEPEWALKPSEKYLSELVAFYQNKFSSNVFVEHLFQWGESLESTETQSLTPNQQQWQE